MTLTEIRSRVASYITDRSLYTMHRSMWATVCDLGVFACESALNTELSGSEVAERRLWLIITTPGDTFSRREPRY